MADERKPDPPKPMVPPAVAAAKSSGRYRLRGPHVYREGQVLEAGTEVGTDTVWPWPDRPTPLMEGIDDAGKKAVLDLHKEMYGRLPPWALDSENPEYAIHEERRKEQEKETESAPVSYVQAMERDKKWEGPVPVPATSNPSISGSQLGGLNMPMQKVEKPNEELYPKG